MNEVLRRWNRLPKDEAEREILACCGSQAWARGIAERRPIESVAPLLAASDEVWRGLTKQDWLEACESHPRIGESAATKGAPVRSAEWSAEEQQSVERDHGAAKSALAEANREYEARFGRIFIVCASGKGGAEILAILRRRLQNDDGTEWRETAEQQRQITQLRLRKWLGE